MPRDSELRIKLSLKNEVSGELNKINQDLKEFRSESEKGFGELAGSFKRTGLAITGVGIGLGGLLVKTGLTAARVQVLGTVMRNVGRVSGVSTKALEEQQKVIEKLGITTKSARELLIRFMQGQLDVAEASKIARVAQDLAVISGQNSSEAAETLTQAIISQRPVLLKQFGIVQNLSTIYGDYADSLEKAVDELTDVEKRQAFLNVILAEGEKVAGTYEAAMGDVGKQLTSLPRLIETSSVAFGTAFLPVMEKVIKALSDLMKQFIALPKATQQNITKVIALTAGLSLIVGPLLLIIGFIPNMIAGFQAIAAILGVAKVGFMVLLGPVGLVIAALGALVFTAWHVHKNWAVVKALLLEIWIGIKNALISAFDKIGESLSKTIEFLGLWRDEIMRHFTDIGNFIKGVVMLWAEFLRPVWEPMIEATDELFNMLGDKLGEISDFVFTVWEGVRTDTERFWGQIIAIIDKVVKDMKEGIIGVLEAIREAWDSVFTWIVEKIDWVWENVKGPLNFIRNALQGLLNLAQRVISTVGPIVSKITGIGAGIFKLPEFASGGVVPGPIGAPTAAIVHGGERIIPVGGGRAGGGITINIRDNTLLDDNAAEEIGDRIIEILKVQRRFVI
ncbi:MAG TPA: hypothetical protein ENI23_11195 [bacterium]|nr:hypothetical protein [bacterium]